MVGEVEIMDTYNFEAAESQWDWTTTSDVLQNINAKSVSSMHVGKVLAKLVRSNGLVQRKMIHGTKYFLMPPLRKSKMHPAEEDFDEVFPLEEKDELMRAG